MATVETTIPGGAFTHLRKLTRFSALPPLDAAPKALGLDEDAAAEAVAALLNADLVELWTEGAPGGRPRLVLTPWGASLLGFELAEHSGSSLKLQWKPLGKGGDPGPPHENGVVLETDASPDPDRAGIFESLPDPGAIDPAVAAEAADLAEQPAERARTVARVERSGHIPRPSTLLGLRPAWPAVPGPGEPCPGCGDRRLGFSHVCLVCLRSGVDHLIPPPPKPRPTPRYRPRSAGGKSKAAELAGGTGPAMPKRERGGFKPSPTNSFDLRKLRGG